MGLTIPPTQTMTMQGRVYLGAMALRYFGTFIGFNAGTARLSANPSFEVILSVASLRQWSLVFLFMGVTATILGLLYPRYDWFKTYIIFSAGTMISYAAGFFFSFTWTPAVFSYTAFALTDVIVASMPRQRFFKGHS